MASTSALLWQLAILALCLGAESVFFELKTTMKESSADICFEVNSQSSSSPDAGSEMALVLEVRFSQSLNSAGETHLKVSDLPIGLHNVSYKYRITNMTHDMQVWLDGAETKFVKSEVPMWYSVSAFEGVLVLVKGDISIFSCSNETTLEETNPASFSDDEFDKHSDNEDDFFIREHTPVKSSVVTTRIGTEATPLPIDLEQVMENVLDSNQETFHENIISDATTEVQPINETKEGHFSNGISDYQSLNEITEVQPLNEIKEVHLLNGTTEVQSLNETTAGEVLPFNETTEIQPLDTNTAEKVIPLNWTKEIQLLNGTTAEKVIPLNLSTEIQPSNESKESYPPNIKTELQSLNETIEDLNKTRVPETQIFQDIASSKPIQNVYIVTSTTTKPPLLSAQTAADTVVELPEGLVNPAGTNLSDSSTSNSSSIEREQSESILECMGGSCESATGHDYSLGYILLGSLGGLMFLAIVISLVFHRKKKKLVAVSQGAPTNRLRQKLYEDAFEEGECQMMLKGVNQTYEEIP